MVTECFAKAMQALKRYKLQIIGITLLCLAACKFVEMQSGALKIVSALFFVVVLVGLSRLCLDAYEGKDLTAESVFASLSSPRIIGGMAWTYLVGKLLLLIPVHVAKAVLYVFVKASEADSLPLNVCASCAKDFEGTYVWSAPLTLKEHCYELISDIKNLFNFHYWENVFDGAEAVDAQALTIVGVVFALLLGGAALAFVIYKLYDYRFVPYILLTNKDVKATAALKESKMAVKGKKSSLITADLIFAAPLLVYFVGLNLLAGINETTDKIFTSLANISIVAVVIFIPVFAGLYSAAFFTAKARVKAPKPMYQNYNNGPRAPYNPQGGQYGGQPQGGQFQNQPQQGRPFQNQPPQGGQYGGQPQGGQFQNQPPQGGQYGAPPQNFNNFN